MTWTKVFPEPVRMICVATRLALVFSAIMAYPHALATNWYASEVVVTFRKQIVLDHVKCVMLALVTLEVIKSPITSEVRCLDT